MRFRPAGESVLLAAAFFVAAFFAPAAGLAARRAAQRFFIIFDIRFLAAGLMRFFVRVLVPLTFVWAAEGDEADDERKASKAPMA
jgi:hypothetical protein